MLKFNLLKYKEIAPPLRIKTLKAIGLFLFSFAIICAVNACLIGSFHYASGRIGHTLVSAVILSGFLWVFRNDRRDMLATLSLYLLLLVPVILLSTLVPHAGYSPKNYARAVSESNNWALSISIMVMFVTASSCLFKNHPIRYLIRCVSALLWVAAVTLSLIFIGYWISHRAVLSSDILVALYQTNAAEAIEYLSFKGGTLTGVILASAVILTAVSIRTLTCRQSLKTLNRTVSVIASVMLAASMWNTLKTDNNLTFEVFRSAIDTVKELDTFKAEVAKRKELIESLSGLAGQGRKGLFVFIIGESQTRDRMSAYGYERPTTPWLAEKRGDRNFVFLEQAYSCFVNTVPALSNALTAKNQYSERSLASSPSIVEITHAAGYETHWISNQNRYGIWDTPNSVIADQADHHVWLNRTVGAKVRSQVYDDALVEELKKIPVNPEGKTLVFLHILGCHGDYIERYPSDAAVWNSKDGKPNTYDNAMLFNDGVNKAIWEVLKYRPDFQALVFMSDHGEDIEEGHSPDRFRWSMTHIPMWAAFAPGFIKEVPQVLSALRANAGLPFTNDMFFDTVCGILDVRNHPYYEKRNDISGNAYDRPLSELLTLLGKKRIAEDPVLGKND